MNQIVPLSTGLRQLWLAHPTLPGLVPGGLLYGLEKAGTLRPLASLKISLDGEPEYQTGLIYVQAYRLLIQVWAGEALSQSGAIQTALETLLGATTKIPALTQNAWTLHCSLEPAGIEEPLERFQGKFTFIAGATWQIQLQETRNAG